MAESQATLWIKLKDDVTSGLNKIKGSLPSFKAILGGVTVALGVMGAALKASFDSFLENEVAVNRLNTALKAQGFFTKEYSAHLQELAAALQKTTTFSDESVMETQQLLTTFGLAGVELEKTTKAALDLSTGLGIDLRTATLMLGKAWTGETSTLSRYGIKISETASSAEKFNQVMAQVTNRFGGSAAAATQTLSGRMEVLKNQWDETKESIGALLVGPAEKLLTWTGNMIVRVQGLVVAWNDWKNVRAGEKTKDRIEELEKEIFAIEGSAASLSTHAVQTEETKNRLSELTAELVKAKAEFEKLSAAPLLSPLPGSKAIPDEGAIKLEDKLLEEHKKKIQQLTLTNEEIDAINTQHMVDELDFLGRHEEAKNLLAAQAVKDGETINKQRVASTMTALQMLSTLSTAKTKEIAAVGKAAAIATIMVNASLAASQAFAAFAAIPPLAFTMAGIMYAAGMAQAAQAAGVPLAEGGLINPTMGGTHALIGEAGRAEAVIPLDDPRTKEKLRDTLGGGSSGEVHIHIAEGGTVIADDYSLEQFARKIDEKLFSFRRNRQSTAFD